MNQLWLTIKAKIIYLLPIITAFILPIKPLLILVGLFIVADTFAGIYSAKKLNVPITSRRLSDVISKMVLYEAAVVLFFAMEKYMLEDFVKYFIDIPLVITKLVAIFLISIEFFSIDEKIKSITGRSIWERAKVLLRRAKTVKAEVGDLLDKDSPAIGSDGDNLEESSK